MALAGGRRIKHASREYEWVVRRRRDTFRLVAQDAEARGQLVVARFPVYMFCELNESHGDYYMRTRITPWLLQSKLAQAFQHGWRPTEKGLPPLLIGSAGSWGLEDACFFQLIDGLWTVLDAICRDPDWRVRLGRSNAGDYGQVPPEYVHRLDSRLEGRLAAAGGLYVQVRPRDYHGDATPHLAIYSEAWRRELVLEEIAEWYRG
jgi:hypothetical protein